VSEPAPSRVPSAARAAAIAARAAEIRRALRAQGEDAQAVEIMGVRVEFAAPAAQDRRLSPMERLRARDGEDQD